jgi:hypothetical protein
MFDPSGLKSRYTRLVEWESEGGMWINYFTKTVPERASGSHVPVMTETTNDRLEDQLEDGDALLANGSLPPPAYSSSNTDSLLVPSSPAVHTASTKSDAKSIQKQADKQLKLQEKQAKQEEKDKAKLSKKQEKDKNKKPKQERHFVVLPTGMGQFLGGMEKWERVQIAGVDDEVNAHTGLFIPSQNLEYEALVDRVADRLLGWCDRLPQVKHI